jgi:hypothetical protein
MLKAVLTSYQLFLGGDYINKTNVSGQLTLLAKLEDCSECNDKPNITQTADEIPTTTAIGKLIHTKQVGEMIFGVFESVYPIGIGIKIPCGMKVAPILEGKLIKASGEFQIHITPEIEELEAKPVLINKIVPCNQTDLGDIVVSLEGIVIVG